MSPNSSSSSGPKLSPRFSGWNRFTRGGVGGRVSSFTGSLRPEESTTRTNRGWWTWVLNWEGGKGWTKRVDTSHNSEPQFGAGYGRKGRNRMLGWFWPSHQVKITQTHSTKLTPTNGAQYWMRNDYPGRVAVSSPPGWARKLHTFLWGSYFGARIRVVLLAFFSRFCSGGIGWYTPSFLRCVWVRVVKVLFWAPWEMGHVQRVERGEKEFHGVFGEISLIRVDFIFSKESTEKNWGDS